MAALPSAWGGSWDNSEHNGKVAIPDKRNIRRTVIIDHASLFVALLTIMPIMAGAKHPILQAGGGNGDSLRLSRAFPGTQIF